MHLKLYLRGTSHRVWPRASWWAIGKKNHEQCGEKQLTIWAIGEKLWPMCNVRAPELPVHQYYGRRKLSARITMDRGGEGVWEHFHLGQRPDCDKEAVISRRWEGEEIGLALVVVGRWRVVENLHFQTWTLSCFIWVSFCRAGKTAV